jgi:malonyl-CoA decarboxylase
MSDRAGPGFLDSVLDRTIGNLRHVWRDIAASARGVMSSAPKPDLSREDEERVRTQLRECLEGKGGEVSARARAASLGRTYLALNEAGRERFLRVLATEFDIDRASVQSHWERLRRAKSEDEQRRLERALHQALEAPRIKLLTQFNALPEGVKFLVDMRAELMNLGKGDPMLASLELDLKDLLASWFDIGFLEVRRITWDSPASLLEKLTGYEAVHAIRSWQDLKNRLEADRRCFAYFHPRMPDEPLIFVEVALTQGMSDDVQLLLDEKAPLEDPAEADTAIFYSISNCQRGLTGISFGDFLIKRVVDQLAAELPHLTTYATLSPVPGFRPWLEKRLAGEGDIVLTPAERKALDALPGDAAPKSLQQLLAKTGWHRDDALAQAARAPLLRLAARYLLAEKTPAGRALDPVAHFHLSNGARVERLDWRADLSPKGLQQSHGMMINYLYRLDAIEANHEAYSGEGKIAASSALQKLAKG